MGDLDNGETMPALRNRSHLVGGANGFKKGDSQLPTVNGFKQHLLDDNETFGDKLEGQEQKIFDETRSNMADKLAAKDSNNNSNNIEISNDKRLAEEVEDFGDVATVGGHAQPLPPEEQDSQVPVFGGTGSSIGKAARDQFAVALLRLQADLEATGGRLGDIEAKVDTIQKRQAAAAAAAAKQSSSRDARRDILIKLAYLGWPVLVFVALRAIERRSLAAKSV